MNSKKVIALTDDCVCMKCLKKKATHQYNIYGRGYGSIFDNFNSKFQLCDDCAKDEYLLWTSEIPEEDLFVENYKYESDIHELIDSFPLEAQELFWNHFSDGACSYLMDAQDWIDYQLNELPHEKCKEYGLFSNEERIAYQERFPKCEEVTIKIYKDGSKGSRCPYGAFGDEEGNIRVNNISEECYACPHYKMRKGVIPVEDYFVNEKQRLINIIEDAMWQLRQLNELEKKKNEKK